ncbi:Acetate kinase [Trichinella spiralis]|uniref:Acetate kinase n=1 Tax=Trichinella spiralis TaxID=6334 RepID=A0ABR3KTJ4_TRISP
MCDLKIIILNLVGGCTTCKIEDVMALDASVSFQRDVNRASNFNNEHYEMPRTWEFLAIIGPNSPLEHVLYLLIGKRCCSQCVVTVIDSLFIK